MDPIRKLRSELQRGVSRAWERLADGAREMLTRSHGAISYFNRTANQQSGRRGPPDFPRWGFLASECWETAQAIIVRIELPGMRREDIDVSVSRGRLRVRGEKRNSDGPNKKHYQLMERAFGRFERSFPLSSKVDPKASEISYKDGIVTVILPKTAAAPPTQPPGE
jgi:HSP20 family protein